MRFMRHFFRPIIKGLLTKPVVAEAVAKKVVSYGESEMDLCSVTKLIFFNWGPRTKNEYI